MKRAHSMPLTLWRCQLSPHDFIQQLMVMVMVVLAMHSMLLMPVAYGDSDWMQACGSCHCHWNSGKKTADCKNKSFYAIPHDLSNELQVIDFSNNKIPELRREEFMEAKLNNVHKLFLRSCTIQELNKDALRGLTILIELDLSHNNITALHPNTFSGVERIRILVFTDNQIEVLPDYLFDNLKFLSRVDFTNNHLKHVATNSFRSLPMLSSVHLESNRLTVLHKDTFSNKPKLIQLGLTYNPWNCTCDLQEFRDFVVSTRLYTPPTSCSTPLHLRGKQWNEISSDNYACKPRILGSVRTFIETQSDNATLTCRVEGTPRPNVTWVYNKRMISASDYRFRIINSFESNENDAMTSDLHIIGLRLSDKGVYTCIADNRGGRAESEFQLLINADRLSAITDGQSGGSVGATTTDIQSNVLLVICLIAMAFLLLLIIMVLVICWYCRRIKTYQKDTTMMSENGLISSKLEKAHNASMLEGGSVIMEMQKSLLTEVNPVEKPPRRTELESVDGGGEESLDIKKTLLDETPFGHHHLRDDETHSIALSDTTTTPRSRHTYVDDNYGNSLPPDLLAFPARVPPTPPSMQSSQSNIPEQIIYGIRSPQQHHPQHHQLTSPVYAHMTPHGIYGTTIATAPHATAAAVAAASNGFLTLQHPKSRNLALIAAANNRQQQQQHQLQLQQHLQQQQLQQQLHHPQQSPFVPAPVVYAPAAAAVVMKQGYMTIPRKPRVPSWAPSTSSVPASVAAAAAVMHTPGAVVAHQQQQLSGEFQSPTSPNPSETGTATTAELQAEPVYDNLGLRTTAGGNSTLNLHKVGGAGGSADQQRYTMRDRPLPATPSLSSVASNATMQSVHSAQAQTQTPQATAAKIYEPILELRATTLTPPLSQPQQVAQPQLQPQPQLNTTTCDTEPLYGTARHHSALTLVPSAVNVQQQQQQSMNSSASPTSLASTVATTSTSTSTLDQAPSAAAAAASTTKLAKIPPRPPPKPKKKLTVTATRSGQGSTSQLFDDEGEDGTEV